MNEDLQKTIDQYLHGELSGDRLDEFEENFFVDDDLFEQIETAEMRLIDKYVRDEMNVEEVRRFEEGYLVSPERRSKTSEARAFHRELQELTPRSKSFLRGLLGGFSFRIRVLQFASIAAVLLIAIGTIWTIWIFQTKPQPVAVGNTDIPEVPVNLDVNGPSPQRNPDDRGNNNGAKPSPTPPVETPPVNQGHGGPVFATLAMVPGMRTTNVFRAVRIADDTTKLNLSVRLPESAAEGDYSVSIRDTSGNEIWSRPSIRAERDDKGLVVQAIIDRPDLKPGRFRVAARHSETEDTYEYGLEILKEGVIKK